MSTIYVHIGFEKTGSTAIQDFLDNNRDVLYHGHNLVHLDCLSNNDHIKLIGLINPANSEKIYQRLKLNSAQQRQNFKDAFSMKLQKQISNAISSNKNIVISSEHLSSYLNSEIEIETFSELLTIFKKPIKVIAYIRRQDKFILSRYSTWIKNGGKNDLKVSPNNKILQYATKLKMWGKVFGNSNLVAKEYNRAKIKDNNIVSDFLHTIDIQITEGLNVDDKPQNKSLDQKSLFILKELNKHLPLFINGRINELRGNIAKELSELELGDKVELSKNDSQIILNAFLSENIELRKQYNIDFVNEAIEYSNLKQKLEFNDSNNISKDDLYLVLAKLWERQQKKVLWLINRVNELENPESIIDKPL